MSHVLDLGSRKFWQLTGREVDLDGAESWLRAPASGLAKVGAEWLEDEAARHGGTVEYDAADAGLLPSLAALDGPGFAAADVRPEIRDFYEHTSAWQMEVWTGWSPVFWPAGELIARVWGRRVEQLALPMNPLDVAHGMDSEVTPIRDAAGAQVSAAWTRRLRSNGRPVFSGAYSPRTLPGADRASVHVAFPLESGNLQVFLRPSVVADGELLLSSGRGSFGDDGAYVLVHDVRDKAARVPLHETFHVYVDPHGTLRTDHVLRFGRTSVMRLHYKLGRV